jgi:hypothetical protein
MFNQLLLVLTVKCIMKVMDLILTFIFNLTVRGGKVSMKASTKQRQISEDEETEGLALLIPDIQETARIVNVAISKVLERCGEYNCVDI